MATKDLKLEKSGNKYQAQLKHIDNLIKRAEQAALKNEAVKKELQTLKKERAEMERYVDGLKQKSPQEFMETAGPMVMWEIAAGKLEKLLEKIKIA